MRAAARTLVLFDIDGTLVHAAGVGRAAIEVALVEVYGTAGPIDELPFDGLTDPHIARSLLGAAGLARTDIDAGLDDLWRTYVRHLGLEIEQRRDGMRPEVGVPAILDHLDELGATVGLVTGNIVAGAEGKLTACGLWKRFRFGAYGSDAADRNALPPIALERAHAATGTRFEAHRTWIIGDTPQDIACAHASGLMVLAVATGRFSEGELKRAGADHTMPNLEDTAQVLATLDGA